MKLIDKIQEARSNKLSDYSKIYTPTAEVIEGIVDEFAISFYNWMRKNDTQENSCKYFHYPDKDMLNAFKEEKGL